MCDSLRNGSHTIFDILEGQLFSLEIEVMFSKRSTYSSPTYYLDWARKCKKTMVFFFPFPGKGCGDVRTGGCCRLIKHIHTNQAPNIGVNFFFHRPNVVEQNRGKAMVPCTLFTFVANLPLFFNQGFKFFNLLLVQLGLFASSAAASPAT